MNTTAVASPFVPPETLLHALACPKCRRAAAFTGPGFHCPSCGMDFGITNSVLDFRPSGVAGKQEVLDWTEHWSDDKQESAAQRFFSVYRKAVFARAVAYFVGHFLAPEGLLVEAGSGTSETSMLIDKRNGKRVLAALDLIQPVLERCHPVMDIRVCGDIFRLPFQDNTVDGIWNVGVMEHFTHDQIDAIMREFHRVLKHGGRVVLLWPAIFSIPQRILRILEFFINLRRECDRFRFHPDEISQLRSAAQGRSVLNRNGFAAVSIDLGLRTGMAFETLVGQKDK
jgi:SAM-dependent methyltransferase